ncbi:MAG: lysylphosphatidylglycerol synthase transmembrane domain-containing protein [Verrucomicrobiota bacterium]
MSDVVEEKRSGTINWGFWIRLLVAGSIIGLIVWKNDWELFFSEFLQADWFWLAAAFLSFGLNLLIGAARWLFLLRVQGIVLPYRETLTINMVGLFFNQFLFGSTGGDLIKIFYAIRKAPDKKAEATLSMVMDRVLGLIAILGVTFLLIPLEWSTLSQHEETRRIVIGLAVVLTGVFAGLAMVFFFPLQVLPQFVQTLWLKIPKREVVESLYNGMQAHGKQSKYTCCAVGTAVLTVIPLLSVGWFLAKALHLDIAYGPMTILFAIVLCAMSIPLFPGGHGIREGAFFLLFGLFSVSRHGQVVGEETALACSTLFLMTVLVWSLAGGAVYLFFSSYLKQTTVNM